MDECSGSFLPFPLSGLCPILSPVLSEQMVCLSSSLISKSKMFPFSAIRSGCVDFVLGQIYTLTLNNAKTDYLLQASHFYNTISLLFKCIIFFGFLHEIKN